jgi:hypothetical protein
MLSLLLPTTVFGINVNVLLLSLVLMITSAMLLVWLTRWPPDKKGTIKYDIVKDSALALLTAVLVTAIYSSVMEFRRVSDVFSLFIGSEVRPEVLDTVKAEVFKREIMRDNAHMRFTVIKDSSLPRGQALLGLEIGYNVHSLKPEGDRDYKFIQELDNIWVSGKDKEGGDVPRFDEVTVGERIYRGDELKSMVTDGLFEDQRRTHLNPWPQREVYAQHKTGVRIKTKRTELINIPGSYTLVLGELTKAIRVQAEVPPDMQYKFKSSFQRKGHDFRLEGTEQYFDGIVLPGQSITLQFWDKSASLPSARPLAAAPARTKARGQ